MINRAIPAIILIVVLILTLLSYFSPTLSPVREAFVQIAVLAAAFALIVGVWNLFAFHIRKVIKRQPGAIYSVVLILSMTVVLVFSVVDASFALVRGVPFQELPAQGFSGPILIWVYRYVLVPLQSSLVMLLPFVLAFAAFRMLRVHRSWGAVIFLITAIIVLIGQVPLVWAPELSGLRDAVVRLFVTPGMRGILLGVALGVTATAIRMIIEPNRPSSER